MENIYVFCLKLHEGHYHVAVNTSPLARLHASLHCTFGVQHLILQILEFSSPKNILKFQRANSLMDSRILN